LIDKYNPPFRQCKFKVILPTVEKALNEGFEDRRKRAQAIYAILAPLWPDARPLLAYSSDFELLVSVILSAQCTDEQVNRVTPALFERWPDAAALAKARPDEVEGMIHSVGFFRTKAAHLVAMAGLLVERHEGAVPLSMEALLDLPGVGRKTANLVYSACSGGPGIIVDTHVARVVTRLGLSEKDEPALCEKRIASLIPREKWTRFSHAVNRHGKFVCRARKPACEEGSGLAPCPLFELCPRLGFAPRPKRKASPPPSHRP
jgi:endonuclease III